MSARSLLAGLALIAYATPALGQSTITEFSGLADRSLTSLADPFWRVQGSGWHLDGGGDLIYVKRGTDQRLTGSWLQASYASALSSRGYSLHLFGRTSEINGEARFSKQNFNANLNRDMLRIVLAPPKEHGLAANFTFSDSDVGARSGVLDHFSKLFPDPKLGMARQNWSIGAGYQSGGRFSYAVGACAFNSSGDLSLVDREAGNALRLDLPESGSAFFLRAGTPLLRGRLDSGFTHYSGKGDSGVSLNSASKIGLTHYRTRLDEFDLEWKRDKGASMYTLGLDCEWRDTRFSGLIYQASSIGVNTVVDGRLDLALRTEATSKALTFGYSRSHRRNGRSGVRYSYIQLPTTALSDYAVRFFLNGIGDQERLDGHSWRSHLIAYNYSQGYSNGRQWTVTVEQWIPMIDSNKRSSTSGGGSHLSTKAYGGLAISVGLRL